MNIDPSSDLDPRESQSSDPLFNLYSSICSDFPVSVGEALAWDSLHIYGEVLYPTLSDIFSILRKRNLLSGGEIFYDLGSGIGKAVVAASLLHNFSKCCGIELVRSLFEISGKVKENYEKAGTGAGHGTRVEFFNADILEFDWSDCDVFFINSTCFDEDFMRRVGEKASRKGVVGISTSKRMDKSKWRLIETSKKPMSWGNASVFIHVRK